MHNCLSRICFRRLDCRRSQFFPLKESFVLWLVVRVKHPCLEELLYLPNANDNGLMNRSEPFKKKGFKWQIHNSACVCLCVCVFVKVHHTSTFVALLFFCSAQVLSGRTKAGEVLPHCQSLIVRETTAHKSNSSFSAAVLICSHEAGILPRVLIGPVSASMLVHSQTIGVSLRITESLSFFVVAPTVGLRAAVCVLELLFWCQQQLPKWKILWRDTPVCNFKAVHRRSFPGHRKHLLFKRAKGSNISDLSSCHPHLSLCAKSTTRKCLSSSWLNRRGQRLCGTRTNIWRAEPLGCWEPEPPTDKWTHQIYRLHVFAP